MKPGCIGKSNTNNLPAPTDLTENPYGKKTFFKAAIQISAPLVRCGIAIETVPTEPIFEKCSHLREKGGVLTQIRVLEYSTKFSMHGRSATRPSSPRRIMHASRGGKQVRSDSKGRCADESRRIGNTNT